MKPENKAFLEANRHHWITLRDAFYVRMLDGNTRLKMMQVMGEEFRPGYTSDLWCGVCVADMVRALYQEFEKWEAQLIMTVPEMEDFAKRKSELIERWMKDTTDKVGVLNGPLEFVDLFNEPEAPPKEEPTAIPAPVKPIKANFPSHKNRRR